MTGGSRSPAQWGVNVSEDGRHFVDGQGEPWFFLGDTLWELFRMYTPDEAEVLVRRRIAQGFSVLLVMLNGVPEGGNLGMPGRRPWGDDCPPAMDEEYFRRVDTIVERLAALDVVFIVGVYHKSEATRFTRDAAREYARRVASRYRDVPNIVWCMYPEASEEYREICRAIAAGLAEGDGGRHLISVHPDPAPGSSSFFAGESWIAFNMLQVCVSYDRLHPLVLADYRCKPPKPAVMAEGGYEGLEFKKLQGAHEIRMQAYWTFCAGGHHVYGHNNNYAAPGAWRDWVDSPGVAHLTVFRKLVTALDSWWTCTPDQGLLVERVGEGLELNTACRAADGRWVLLYLSGANPATVDLGAVGAGGQYDAEMIDPRTGEAFPLAPQSAGDRRVYRTPAGWEDAVICFSR